MSIRARLYAIAVAAALTACIAGLTGISADRSLQRALVRMESETIPQLDALHTLRFAALRVLSSTNEYTLVQEERRRTADASVPAPGPDTDEVAMRKVAAAAFNDTLRTFEEKFTASSPERQELATQIKIDGQDLIESTAAMLAAVDQKSDPAAVLAAKGRVEAAERRLLPTLEAAIADYAAKVPLDSRNARSGLTRQVRLGLVAIAVAALLVLVLVGQIGRSIAGGLDRLNQLAQAVAGGTADQVTGFKSEDEVGRLAATVNKIASDARRATTARIVADAIVSSLPNALLVTDSKLAVSRANQAALKLLGATDPMQIIGRKLSEISTDIAAPAQRVKTTLLPTTVETSVVKRAGAPVPVSISLSPLAGVPDQSRGLVCLAEDVRERREAERLLIEARDRAQASDRGKSEFLATMSHELRTPLNAIIGYSQMLQEAVTDPDSLEDVRKIESASSDLLRTVDRVLELANAESGKTVLTLEPFPVAALVAEVRSENESLAGRRNNLFHVTVAPDVGTMVADRVKIRQILTNLVGNACKFTERGTVTLTVNRVDVGGQPWLSFEVNDTGVGMSDEQMTTLFTPFDATAGRRYSGTGLGLALASRFCRMMSGSIDVSSAPGRGSCFTVKLPQAVPSIDLAA